MLEVVRGKRPILRGQCCAVLIRQLLGVEPHAQTMVRGGLEEALDLLRREGDGFTKGINAGGDALLRGGGNELVHDFADVVGAAVALVARDRVEGKQGRDDPYGFAIAEFARDLQKSEL